MQRAGRGSGMCIDYYVLPGIANIDTIRRIMIEILRLTLFWTCVPSLVRHRSTLTAYITVAQPI
jgi:hypothetical protein